MIFNAPSFDYFCNTKICEKEPRFNGVLFKKEFTLI